MPGMRNADRGAQTCLTEAPGGPRVWCLLRGEDPWVARPAGLPEAKKEGTPESFVNTSLTPRV